jgi:cell shape-determining protein MreC
MFRKRESPIISWQKKIKSYINQSSRFIKTIILITLVIILIVFFNTNDNKIRTFIVNSSYEIYGHSSLFINSIYNQISAISFCSYEKLYDPAIERENKYLKLQNSILDEQIQLLKAQIKLIDNQNYSYITAMVTQVTYPQDEIAFVLSAGVKDGVSIGNIVLDEDGVIGRISAVTNNYSVVSLMGNDNVKISVIILPSDQNAIIGKRFDPYHLELNYISDLSKIHDGDSIITSGQDGLNPYGISIGVVRIFNDKPFIVQEERSAINKIVKILTLSN